MDHLFAEHSVECLLSLVEFTQSYESKMKEEFTIIEFKAADLIIELPDKMVKSKIIYGQDDYKK